VIDAIVSIKTFGMQHSAKTLFVEFFSRKRSKGKTEISETVQNEFRAITIPKLGVYAAAKAELMQFCTFSSFYLFAAVLS